MSEAAIVASPPPSGTVYAIIGQTVPSSHLKEAIENPDALHVAYNVGVLELLSLGLTLFAIVLAVVAVLGFWMIRGAAIKAADKAAREEVKELVPKLAQEWFEREGRKIIESASQAVAQNEMPNIDMKEKDVLEALEEAEEIKDL